MKNYVVQRIHVKGEVFILHPLRFLYWENKGILICADVHIGKGGHFRKHGIAIPRMANKNNFWNLSGALDYYRPSTLLVLGDMVHSAENKEWQEFSDFLENYPGLRKVLIRGNHELFEDHVYESMGFEVTDELEDSGFLFTHEPTERDGLYNLHGHIHPALHMSGPARQHLKAPCFLFGEMGGVLPAFGEFTGTHKVKPRRGDQVYVVTGNEVIEIRE